MSNENEPLSQDAVSRAQQYAENVAKIEVSMGALKEGAEAQLFIQQQTAKIAEDEIRRLKEAEILGELKVEQIKKQIDGLAETKENEAKIKALKAEQLQIQKDINEAQGRDLVAEQGKLDLLKQEIDAKEESLTLSKELEHSTKLAAEALTGIGDSWKKSATGAFLSKMSADGFGAALKDVGKSLKENFKLENLAGSVIMAFIQQTMKSVSAMDNAHSSFAKVMGTGDDYNDTITAVYDTTDQYGVTADEASAATQALAADMAGFGKMSDTAQRQLGSFNAILGELGVSGGDGAAMLQRMDKQMGLSADESVQMGADLHAVAGVLGTSFSKVVGDFNAVMGDLAVYGKEAPVIFKKMAGAANKLGISVDSLVGSMSSLNSIQGSMRRAGDLNMILEGQFIDSNELMNASLEDKLKLQLAGIKASGKTFESMGMMDRELLAEALQLKNVGELQQVMTTNLGELGDAMEKAGSATGSLDKLNENAEEGQSNTDRWAKAMANFGKAFAPVLEGLTSVITWISKLMENEFFVWLLGGLAVLYFAGRGFLALKSTVAGVRDAFSSTKAPMEEGAKVGKSFGETIREVGSAASENVKGILALGAAFIMIGIGVFIAAYGVAELVRSFAGFSAGEILAISLALAVFGAMMVGMAMVLSALMTSGALPVATAGIYAFGIAMILVGAAIWIAAHAFKVFVEGFLMLLPHLPEFAAFALILGGLAIAGMLMLPGGLMAMIGLILMAVGIAALGLSLKLVSSDDLRSLGMMMTGLGEVAKYAGEGMGDSVGNIKDMMDHLLDMKTQITPSIWMFRALGDAFVAIGMGAQIASMYLPGMVEPLMLIGASIIIWNAAMGILLKQLPQFFAFNPQWWDTFFLFSLLVPVVLTLAFAIALMAATGVSAAMGLMMLSYGMFQLAGSLNKMPTATIDAFMGMLKAINNTTDLAIEKMYTLADAIWDIQYAFWRINGWKMYTFGLMVEHVAVVSKNLNSAAPENAERLVTAATEYSQIKYQSMSNPFEKLISALSKITPPAGTAGKAGGQSGAKGGSAFARGARDIVIEIDGTEVGRAVKVYLEDELKQA